jgi:hypothetical protein
MSNPYIVSLSLSGAAWLLSTDKDQTTVHFVWVEKNNPERMHVAELANKIWVQEFHLSDNDANEILISDDIIVVVYSRDVKGNLKPLSAGRLGIHEEHLTGIKTAKIYSVASIEQKKGYGKLLLKNIRELAENTYMCKFMTVDVTRPIISNPDSIHECMESPVEAYFWSLEKPTQKEIEEQDLSIRRDPLFDRCLALVSPRANYKVAGLNKYITPTACRNIQSEKRTARVQGLLDFYKKCNFRFMIIRGDKDEESWGCEQYLTPWGFVYPDYCYTLVDVLCDVSDPSVECVVRDLSEWEEYTDLEANYDSFE